MNLVDSALNLRVQTEIENPRFLERNARQLLNACITGVSGTVFAVIGVTSYTLSKLTCRCILPLNEFADGLCQKNGKLVTEFCLSILRTFNPEALPEDTYYLNQNPLALKTILPQALEYSITILHRLETFCCKNKSEEVGERESLERKIKASSENNFTDECYTDERNLPCRVYDTINDLKERLRIINETTCSRKLFNRVSAKIGSTLMRIITLTLSVVTFPLGLIAGVFACIPCLGRWNDLNEFAIVWITIPLWTAKYALDSHENIHKISPERALSSDECFFGLFIQDTNRRNFKHGLNFSI